MSKYLLGGAVAAAAMVAVSPAIAQAVQPAPAPNVLIQRAPMAAKVHTRAEVGTHVRTMFERLDSNRDGFVTKAEAQAAKAARGDRGDRRGKRIERRGAGSPDRRTANRGAMFDRIDSNRDGSLSRSEFEAAPMRQQRRVAMRSDGQPGARPEGMRMRGMRMGMGGLRGPMFDMADANRDGRVTLQEATAAAHRHFDMADANRDGQVTPQERMQMRQRMRAERRPG